MRNEKRKKKNLAKATAVIGILTLVAGGIISGCGVEEELPEVTLSVWGSKADQEVLKKMVDSFEEEYGSEADFNITVSAEGEDTCKDTVLSDPAAAADVYSIASDQFSDLQRAGALLEITENTEKIIDANGGESAAAVQSAMADGKLYAYPSVAGNGYFLYYNAAYYDPVDVASMDRLLEIAAENGKKVSMELTSGWYSYSFFQGAGLSVGINENGNANTCNWNATDTTYTGVQVAQAILDIAKHEAFLSCVNDDFVGKAESGEVIAGINGTWSAKQLEKAWGENYAATKLPTYTLDSEQIQMHSFVGYKLMSVNAHTKEPKWSMRLAEWLTNERNQKLRYEERGDGPTNVTAAASEGMQNDVALSALNAQSQFAHLQNVLDTYWTPTNVFGTIMSTKNPDGTDLQVLLDQMVEGITAPQGKESEEVTS